MLKQLNRHDRYRIYILLLLLFSIGHMSAQEDEIVLRKTGQPLDYEIRIVVISKDTIKYKAFKKEHALPLSEVLSYRYNGKDVVVDGVLPDSKNKEKSVETKKGKSSKGYNLYDATLGVGMGLDYGGFGINCALFFHKNIGMFAGAGFALAGLGWNAGLKVRQSPESDENPIYFTAMYGYNTSVYIINAEYYNKLFYGFSAGLGIDHFFKKSRHSGISTAVLFPFRTAEARHYINRMEDMGIIKIGPLPVAFSIGLKF